MYTEHNTFILEEGVPGAAPPGMMGVGGVPKKRKTTHYNLTLQLKTQYRISTYVIENAHKRLTFEFNFFYHHSDMAMSCYKIFQI